MRMKSLLFILFTIIVTWIMLWVPVPGFCCTDIIVGKKASADGSVITSHTGCADDCRVLISKYTNNKQRL